MKRFSFVSSSDAVDGDIDELMNGLYPDFISLEQKCQDSVCGSVFIKSDDDDVAGNAEHQSLDRSAEDVVDGLPIEYFTANFDPVEGHLIEISSWTGSNIIEQFMNKIEETDTDKDVIIGHLTGMIDENYDDLMACMTNVQSIDIDLCRAGIQVNMGRRKIASANGILKSGAIRIKELNSKRVKLSEMADTIRDLKALKDVHREMTNCINVGEVGRAAELARSLLDTLNNSSFDQFAALKSIDSSMQKNVLIIRQKSDKSLKRLCSRKFVTSEYDSIVTSYLTLDRLAETHRLDCSGRSSAPDEQLGQTDSSFYFDSFGCIEGLSQRITRFQLEDIDTCVHSAVMEYIYASQHRKQKAAAELDFAGAYSTMKFGEMVDLSELPLNVLYRRLSPDVVAPCVIRSCELLADVIHTNYLITQWHCSPFDQRNHDWDHLHRSPIDLRLYEKQQRSHQLQRAQGHQFHESDEEEDADEVRSSDEEGEMRGAGPEEDEQVEPYIQGRDSVAEGGRSSVSSVSSDQASASLKLKQNLEALRLSEETTSSIVSSFEDHFAGEADQSDSGSDRVMRLNGVKLAMAHQHMAQSRTILWEELLRALVEMLNLMSLTSAVRPEDFLSMTTALASMVQLGREFCLSESKALQMCLAEKSREYFQHFHLESFQMMRQMVDAESWQSVPVNLAEVGGILGMVRTNLVRDSCSAGARFGAIHSEDDKRSAFAGASRRPSSMRFSGVPPVDDVPADKDLEESPRTMLMLFGCEGNPFHAMTQALSDKEECGSKAGGAGEVNCAMDAEIYWDALLAVEGGSRKALDRSASLVVTQSALNGLVKYAAKYLYMMHQLPTAAADVFACLCQLFDYYICAVFNGFVPAEEKSRLTTKSSRHTVCAPEQSRDFQSLITYLDRKMAEVVNVGTALHSAADKDSLSELGSGQDAGGASGTHGSSCSNLQQFEAMKMSALLRLPAVITFADPTSCFALNERIVAAESSWFVAMILGEIKQIALRLLPERSRPVCMQYVEQIQMVAGELRALVYRAVCPQMIKHYAILSLIAECSWDTRKLRDTHHDWVDLLVKNCEEVWNYMLLTEDQFAESSALVREQVWLEVCQAAFDLLLDGYSRVRKCSSEGRAAMTMDVFAVHEGLNRTHLCRPPRGKHHLDSYLHMSFLSDEDMMGWIQENWQSFAYRHVAGMVAQTMTSVLSSKKLKDAMQIVDALYDVEGTLGGAAQNTGGISVHGSSNSKLSSLLLSTTSKEGKLSNLISSKFRR